MDAVRTSPECPFSVAMHSPVVTSQILTVLSLDAETMRRPSRKISTLKTCDNGMSSTNRSCGEPQEVNTVSHRGSNTDRNNCRSMVLLVPFKSPNTFACQKLPHFERPVAASRHNAQPVRKHYNVIDLRRRHIITKVQWTPQRTLHECPSSVATHSPVATSQTLSVLSPDPDMMRRPSGDMATQLTYNEDSSSQK